MKTKIKCYGDEVTDFYDKEIPKVDSNRTRLAVISLHSPLNKDYPQVFLKECKYIEKKVIRDIWWFWWFWWRIDVLVYLSITGKYA